MIENLSFGQIVINGVTYNTDILICPDERVTGSWWRKEGHKLFLTDIQVLLEDGPEIIIAGTGMNGMMKPDTELIDYLKKKDIEFMALKNNNAVERYNNLLHGNRLAACFHLTC